MTLRPCRHHPGAPIAAVALALAGLAATPARAQGVFAFATYAPGAFGAVDVSAAVFDRDGASLLQGPGYSAQFYAGPLGTPDDQLQPAGTPLAFPLGGYFVRRSSGPRVAVPGVPAGTGARLQLRAWDNADGTKPTYESASLRVASASFDSFPLSSPTTAANLNVVAPHGLRSFGLPPDPAAVAPVKTGFTTVYVNTFYQDPGNFIPASDTCRSFAARAATTLAEHTPRNPTGPADRRAVLYHAAVGATVADVVTLPAVPSNFGDWSVSDVDADGTTAVGSRVIGNNTRHGFRLDAAGMQDLALAAAIAVSGDGLKVFGYDDAGNLVRIGLDGSPRITLVPGPVAAPLSSARISHDGRSGAIDGRMWTEAAGWLPVPGRDFRATSVSGDGRIFVGYTASPAPSKPAWWSAATGLVVLHDAEAGLSGGLSDASYDGAVLVGGASNGSASYAVWTRDGRRFSLSAALPNGAAAGLRIHPYRTVKRVSYDGRTIQGTSSLDVYPDAPQTVHYESAWVATIAFPGEGPAVARTVAGGRLKLAAPTIPGWSFGFDHGSVLGQWSPLAPPVAGDGGDVVAELDPADASGFVRLRAEKLP